MPRQVADRPPRTRRGDRRGRAVAVQPRRQLRTRRRPARRRRLYGPMTRRHASLLALLATNSLSACGGDEDQEPAAGAPDTSTPAPSPGASPASSDQDGTAIRISFGDTQLIGRVSDNATAHDLAAQLPLTLSFRDHNSVEKTAALPP